MFLKVSLKSGVRKEIKVFKSQNRVLKIRKLKLRSKFLNFKINNSVIMKLKSYFVISSFRNIKTNKFISLIKYIDGSYSYIPKIWGFYSGYFVKVCYWNILERNYNIGSILPLKLIKRHLIFNNVYFNNSNSKYIKSPGTYGKVSDINLEENFCVIKLPNMRHKKVSNLTCIILGRNSNLYNKDIVVSKAGPNSRLGNKPKVRGVAKNPVDHPNGGNSKTKGSFKNPWGNIAKSGK